MMDANTTLHVFIAGCVFGAVLVVGSVGGLLFVGRLLGYNTDDKE